MNSKVYKWCAVPQCTNTSIKTPSKLFVYVPNKKTMRNKWLTLARRDPAGVSANSSIYFCEDHFDLPNDMDNYIEYRVMGSVSQVRMKPGCIPTRFQYQAGMETSSMAVTVLPPQKIYQKTPYDLKGQKGGCSSSRHSLQLEQDLDMPSTKKKKLGNKCMDVECVETRKLVQVSGKTIQTRNARKHYLDYFLNQHKFPTKNAKIFTCMQLRGNTRKWKTGEKRFSLSLYHVDPGCYSFLIDMGIVLPPVATIKRWLSETPVMTSVAELVKEGCGASCSLKEEPVQECGASVKEESEQDCGARVKEVSEKDYGASVKEESEQDCGARVKEVSEKYYGASVKEESEQDCGARVKEISEKDYGASVNEESEQDCGARVKEVSEKDYGASVKEESEQDCGARVKEVSEKYYGASVKEESEQDCGARVKEVSEKDYGASVKEESEQDCGARVKEVSEKDYGASVKEESEQDCGARVKKVSEKYYGASVKEESEQDCGARVKEVSEKDYGASVKEEPEQDCGARVKEVSEKDYGASVKEESEQDCGARVKEVSEKDYGASVKEENGESAAYLYAEQEFKFAVEFGRERLQAQDITLKPLNTATGQS